MYARWQAGSSRRANQIALHENRLNTYKGLVRYRAYVTARGTGIKEEEVWKFAEVCELSEFYFPAHIHTRLESVFKRSLDLMSLNDRWQTDKPEDREEMSELNRKRHSLMKEIRDDCYAIGNELKPFLRVGGEA